MSKHNQIAISILFILSSFSSVCFSQPKKAPNFSYEIEWNSDKTSFDLTITIERGQPEYTVELYDKEPWDNAKLISSKKNISENTISFLNIVPQELYIQVYDATTLKNVKYLKINE